MKRIMGPFVFFMFATACSLLANNAQGQSDGYSEPTALAASKTSLVGPEASANGSQKQIFWHENLESGWRESRRLGRPMVIFITSARCRYCDAMKAETWSDFGIENRIGSEFVAVRLTPELNSMELSRISVQVYPTTLVALPQGKVVDHRTGFQPPSLLHGLLNRVTGRYPD